MFGFLKRSTDSKSLVYQGDALGELRYVIDGDEALKYWDMIKQHKPQMTEISEVIFGRSYNMKVPYSTFTADEASASGYEDISEKIIMWIYDQMGQGNITEDMYLMTWKKLLTPWRIFLHTDGYPVFIRSGAHEYVRDWVLPPEALFYYKKLIDHRFMNKAKPWMILSKDQMGKDVLEPLYLGRDIEVDTEEWGSITIPGIYTDTLDEFFSKDSSIFKQIGKPKKDFQRNIEYELTKRNFIIAARQIGKTHSIVTEIRDELRSHNFFPSDQIKVGLLGAAYNINTKVLTDLDHMMRTFKRYKMWHANTSNSASQGAELYNFRDNMGATEREPYSKVFGMSEEGKTGFDGQQGRIIYIDEVEKLSKKSWTKILPMVMRNPLSRIIATTTIKETGEITWVGEKLREFEQEHRKNKRLGHTMDQVITNIVNKYQLYKYKSIQEMLDNNVDLYQARIDLYTSEIRDRGQRYPIRDDETMDWETKKAIVDDATQDDPIAAAAEYECVFVNSTRPIKREKIESDLSVGDVLRGREAKGGFDFILYILDLKGKGTDDRKLQAWTFDSFVGSKTFNKVVGLKSWEIQGTPEEQAAEVLKRISDFNGIAHKNGENTMQFMFGYDVNGVGQNMEGYFDNVGLPIAFKYHAVPGKKVWYQTKDQSDPKVRYSSKQQSTDDMIEFLNNGNTVATTEMGDLLIQCDQFDVAYTDKGNKIYGAKMGNDKEGRRKNDGEVACMTMAHAYFLYYLRLNQIITENRGSELESMIKKLGRDDRKNILKNTTGDPLEKRTRNQTDEEREKKAQIEREENRKNAELRKSFGY